uniref:Ribosomal protein S6 n=1 Tax=Neobodo designis TaxID=312471 RepID=A0A7S1QPG0_NEODS|mmetsp:Transcript_49580/g.153076  ORF Transcript_49580/g.153076 Transcript_49580/m.153076 type:complete len:155 (+) Transcript_49580:32-496(+)
MVFYNFVIALRMRPRNHTKAMLRELALEIFQAGGVIRQLSNEGVIRTYKGFRDPNGGQHFNSRFINLQVDLSDTESVKLRQRLREHPDVLKNVMTVAEHNPAVTNSSAAFKLDAFTRMEQEMAWPPQVTADAYEHIDMNWKEFSRARWSNYLRS